MCASASVFVVNEVMETIFWRMFLFMYMFLSKLSYCCSQDQEQLHSPNLVFRIRACTVPCILAYFQYLLPPSSVPYTPLTARTSIV